MKSNEQGSSMQQGESCGCHAKMEGSVGQCQKTISEHLQQAAEMYRKAEQEHQDNEEKSAYYEHLGLGHIMVAMKCVKKSLIMCSQKSGSQTSTQQSPESQITA